MNVPRTIHPFPRCPKPARERRLSKQVAYYQCVFRRRRRTRPMFRGYILFHPRAHLWHFVLRASNVRSAFSSRLSLLLVSSIPSIHYSVLHGLAHRDPSRGIFSSRTGPSFLCKIGISQYRTSSVQIKIEAHNTKVSQVMEAGDILY